MLTRFAFLLLLALPLAGCGGGGSNSPASTGSAPAPTPAPSPAPVLSASAVTPDGLTATLAESSATVAVGGSVTYTLTLTNNTAQPVTFVDLLNPDGSGALPGNIGEITDEQGKVFYPAPGGPGSIGPVAGAPTTYTLPPLHSLSATIALSFPFPAGQYAATANFQTPPSLTSPYQNTTVGPLTVTVQ